MTVLLEYLLDTTHSLLMMLLRTGHDVRGTHCVFSGQKFDFFRIGFVPLGVQEADWGSPVMVSKKFQKVHFFLKNFVIQISYI